jgi:hypothetical protein
LFQALLAVAVLSVIAFTARTVRRAQAVALESPSTLNSISGVRQYYLSSALAQASDAPSVCADGYHFASIWEIADPSALRYDTSLGLSGPDSGDGPPTATSFLNATLTARGWVRTGYSYSVTDSSGQANCANWLSNYGLYWGSVANLSSDWTGGGQGFSFWDVGVSTCSTYQRVWCVQDDSVLRTYLPLVLMDS